jgi:hypothetical protein
MIWINFVIGLNGMLRKSIVKGSRMNAVNVSRPQLKIRQINLDTGRENDLAPKFYPTVSSLLAVGLPCWAG